MFLLSHLFRLDFQGGVKFMTALVRRGMEVIGWRYQKVARLDLTLLDGWIEERLIAKTQ
jgi:hypothetical protein